MSDALVSDPAPIATLTAAGITAAAAPCAIAVGVEHAVIGPITAGVFAGGILVLCTAVVTVGNRLWNRTEDRQHRRTEPRLWSQALDIAVGDRTRAARRDDARATAAGAAAVAALRTSSPAMRDALVAGAYLVASLVALAVSAPVIASAAAALWVVAGLAAMRISRPVPAETTAPHHTPAAVVMAVLGAVDEFVVHARRSAVMARFTASHEAAAGERTRPSILAARLETAATALTVAQIAVFVSLSDARPSVGTLIPMLQLAVVAVVLPDTTRSALLSMRDLLANLAGAERLSATAPSHPPQSTAAPVQQVALPDADLVVLQGLSASDFQLLATASPTNWLVPEEPWFAAGSLREIIVGDADRGRDHLAWDALAAVGLRDNVSQLPMRLSTRMGTDHSGFTAHDTWWIAVAAALCQGRGITFVEARPAMTRPELDRLRQLAGTSDRRFVVAGVDPSHTVASDVILNLSADAPPTERTPPCPPPSASDVTPVPSPS
ncbi:MAG: hypothetical protein ACOH2Q_01955 [Rhodococcus sp. (in: high G+C Gram-positive bacteria)]